MKVPLLDIQAQLESLRDDIINAVTTVIDSTQYIGGTQVATFEDQIASYSDCRFGVGVSSGTDALLVALMAMDIGQGDHVITTPYSFFATMGVILRRGAQPLFADIDPVTYNIDPEAVANLLDSDPEKKIKAILPVHLYGQCVDMKPLMDLAQLHKIPIIEDAAQAIGAEYPYKIGVETQWKKSGSMGMAGCFSFFPSKNLGGVGDGGMVVSNDSDFADKMKLLRNHGAHPKYYHELVGGNFRLDPIQAAVLKVKLTHLEDWHCKRRKNAEYYNTLFEQSSLSSRECVSCPRADYLNEDDANNHNYHIYNQYVIRVKNRDKLRDWLREKDIGCEVYYPVPLHLQKCLKNDRVMQSLKEAERAANETIALPVYPELSDQMQEYVVTAIAEFYQ